MEAMTPIERLNTHPTWNELDDLPENSVVLNDLGDGAPEVARWAVVGTWKRQLRL